MQSMLPSATLSRRAPRYSIAALTACAAFGFGSAFAAPAVTSVSGTVANGGQVTINGSGFGTKSKAAPMVWDTVDNESGYSNLSDGATVPVGSSYVFDENSNSGVKFARNTAGRTAAGKAHYVSNGGNIWFGHPIGAGAQNPSSAIRELFLSYWVKFPESPFEETNNASHKFVRIRAGGEDDLRISWTQRQVTVSNSNAGAGSSIPNWNHSDDWAHNPSGWHLHEIWVSANEGRVKTWVDGKLRHDWYDTDPRYLKRTHPAGLEVAILGWNPSHGTKGDLRWEMDDVQVDSTQARVLLSTAARWADSRGHEFQPATSWSDKQITFTANLGQISPTAPIYVYVVNPNGEVNANGFRLTECDKCPNPPTNLSVQ